MTAVSPVAAQDAVWYEPARECARVPVVAQHLARTEAADVQVAVRDEAQTECPFQTTASRRHEGVDERTCTSVVPKHLVGSAAGDVEVAVRAEDDSPRQIQATAAARGLDFEGPATHGARTDPNGWNLRRISCISMQARKCDLMKKLGSSRARQRLTMAGG